jgi:transcriptional regulator with XRE-family HTH domain
MMLTGAQIRMARGYLRLSVREFADAAGVSPATIKRMEEVDGVPSALADNLAKVQRAFEAAGVEFTNNGEPGVKLRRKDPA